MSFVWQDFIEFISLMTPFSTAVCPKCPIFHFIPSTIRSLSTLFSKALENKEINSVIHKVSMQYYMRRSYIPLTRCLGPKKNYTYTGIPILTVDTSIELL